MTTPSFQHGFAPRDGPPKYPGLHNGLVAAWMPYLGPTGTTLFDVSPYHHHATFSGLTGADWTVHRYGWSVLCDATAADYMEAANSTHIDFGTGSFSVSAWFNADSSLAAYAYLVDKLSATAGGFNLLLQNDGDCYLAIDEGSAEDGDSVSTGLGASSYADDEWHLAVGVLDRSVDYSYLYMDGAQVDSDDTSLVGDVSSGGAVRLACRLNDATPFLGYFGPVTLHNRALTPGEIRLMTDDHFAITRLADGHS